MGIPAAMMASMGAAASLGVPGKGGGMRPPFGGRAGAGAAVMPNEAEAAALTGIEAEEDESAALVAEAGATAS